MSATSGVLGTKRMNEADDGKSKKGDADAKAKKGKKGGATDSKVKEPSPCDAYLARLKNKVEELGAEGTMLVKGVKHDKEDEDEDDEKEDNNDKVTAAQVAELRHIIITASRDKFLEAGAKFVTCGQHKDGCMMFMTSHGNAVIEGIANKVATAAKKKNLTERFDALFGLTYALKTYDFWLNDNEYGDEVAEHVKPLAKAWKALLARTDAELGIDTEFTRPGIVSLLTDFGDDLSSYRIQFKWK